MLALANRITILLVCAFVLGAMILFSGLSEDNDYSLEGIEETILTVQVIPTTMALEECFSLCDNAFEFASEKNVSCAQQCKGN